jgi:hypothetical protein
MEALEKKQATNDIKTNILAHDKDGNPIYIRIRLNDECKNGHQDFAITADIYEKDKPKIDRYCLGGGCMHEEIVKARPDLKIFIDLHLCDYKGIPIHCVSNGFYHLIEGFNNTKPGNPAFISKYCEYYRITADQFNELSKSKNEIQFAILLKSLGILKQWEKQASNAIELLENLTNTTFIVDSKRTQYIEPTEEEIKKEEERVKNGYYTIEAEQAREEARRDKIIQKLKAEADKEIKKAKTEYEVKKQVLIIGGEKALNNCIFYNHTNTLAFNWRGYESISEELINKIKESIVLPKSVTIEDKKK